MLETNDDGWFEFPLHPEAHTIYVDSRSGNDAADGLSPESALRTIQRALGMVRDGAGDHIRLKRGSTFNQGVYFGAYISGRSEEYPTLFSAYGDESLARPRIVGNNYFGNLGGLKEGHEYRTQYLAIEHIEIDRHERNLNAVRDPNARGMQFLSAVHDLTIQGCKVHGAFNGFNLQGVDGRHKNVVLHRNVVCDIYATNSGHCQGMYADNVDGLTISECFFDRCGHREPLENGETGSTIFRHAIYVQQTCTDVSVIGSYAGLTGSMGFSLRSMDGGMVMNNLAYRTPIAIQVDTASDDGYVSVQNNVVVDGEDINESNPRGWGYRLANMTGLFANNLMTCTRRIGGFARGLLTDNVFSLELENNVWSDVGGPVVLRGDGHIFEGNRVTSSLAADASGLLELPEGLQPDSSNFVGLYNGFEERRDIGLYCERVLGRSNDPDEYRDMIRDLSVTNFDRRLLPTAVNDWIRDGYDMVIVNPDPVEPDPVDPVEPDPVDPVEPDPVDPPPTGSEVITVAGKRYRLKVDVTLEPLD